MSGCYRKIGKDAAWPAPCEAMVSLDWMLRHMPERITHGDMALAASIISAYRELIALPKSRRDPIISELRHGPNLPRTKTVAASIGRANP